MRIRFLPPDDPAWDGFLRSTPHDFYHLPSYVALCARVDGAEPCALFVEDEDRAALLPLLVRPVGDGRQDAASPYGYPGPIVNGAGDSAFVVAAFAAARAALEERGILSLFVRGHPLLGPALAPEMGTVVEHGLTLSIDLTLAAEELWRHTMSGHRNEINRAIRAGHRAFFDRGFEHLGTFAEIYRSTMARVDAAPQYMFSDDYFEQLRHALGPRLHLCVVAIGDAVAGGGLFVETCGLLQYHLSGTSEAFIRERPTKLMLHHVRTWARERGLRRLHLGGGVGSQDDSLFRFKAGFATDRHRFRTLRLVCDERAYADLVRARHPEADPCDRTGFFPLYRKPA